MKKEFQKPEIEIIPFTATDIITTSGFDPVVNNDIDLVVDED